MMGGGKKDADAPPQASSSGGGVVGAAVGALPGSPLLTSLKVAGLPELPSWALPNASGFFGFTGADGVPDLF